MFCIKCGQTLDPSAEVCPDCGTKVVLLDPLTEKTTQSDIELFEGENTVAADYGAIARKAAAAANANSAHEPVVTETAINPVMQDSVPGLPAGFDLRNVKKSMNGRSILIDDSPLPGVVPAYLVPPVQSAPPVTAQVQYQAEAPVAEKSHNKNIIIIIIAAAVVGLVLVASILFFVLNEKNAVEDNNESSSKDAVTEEQTKNKLDKFYKDDFISDETASGILIENYSDIFVDESEQTAEEEQTEKVPVHRYPSGRPTRPAITPVRPTMPADEPFNPESGTDRNLSDMLNGESETAETAED